MSANTSPIFVVAYKNNVVQIVNSDGTTKKTLLTIGSNGGRVSAIIVSTDDTAAEDFGLYVQRGGSGTVYPLGTKRVALRSGDPTLANNTAPAVNLLDASYIPVLEPDGTLPLGASDVVQVGVQAAVTSGKTATVFAVYGDY